MGYYESTCVLNNEHKKAGSLADTHKPFFNTPLI